MDHDQFQELHRRWRSMMDALEALFIRMDRKIDESRNLEQVGELSALMYHHGWKQTILKWYEPDRISSYEETKKRLEEYQADIQEHTQEVESCLNLQRDQRSRA
eukprot:TRINITY_DN7291_c2_g1_i2.p1 TRINITY_DN7291_c2_g1~~TRINITY_DN7291_c2_g1_i2.p1  ORF type:complete len:104 (-),score=11.20 TRINITY_DN7291_c2_g1_i2:404-715(-)